jgi:hypothetical protein
MQFRQAERRMRLTPWLASVAALVLAGARLEAQTTIIGTVIDSVSGQPVAGAMLYLTDQSHKIVSGANGDFALTGVKKGNLILKVRRIGYEPRALRVAAGESPTTRLDTLRLTPLPVQLTAIQVESTMVANNPTLSDFFRRKRSGAGTYLTQQDIWQQNPLLTSDLLRRIPGITVRCGLGGCTPATMRSRNLRRGGGGCPMDIILDGVKSSVPLDDIPPGWIAGMEVYKGIAFAPMEYGRVSPCGTVIIWTGADADAR